MNTLPLQVYVRQSPGIGAPLMVEEILEAASFWTHIDQVFHSKKMARDVFKVVIKPDLDVFNLALPSGTDHQLVGILATLLRDRGYSNIGVIDSRNCNDNWLLNREPLIVADLVGYDFSGELYEMCGAGDETSPSESWKTADFRINFAKNRTHESQCYALAVHNLLGVSPGNIGDDSSVRCLSVLRESPPHFNIVDALVSFHGAAGERAPLAHRSCTLIAGTDALAVDIVGASKMDLDPYSSPINSKCLKVLGMPAIDTIDGDLSRYDMWQNVHPLVAETARRRNQLPGIGRVAEAWFQSVDREYFPFREFYSDRINSLIAPLMARVGTDPRAQWLAVLLNTLVVCVGSGIQAQHTLFAKGKLSQQVKPIESDLDQFSDTDFTDLPAHVNTFENLMGIGSGSNSGIQLRRMDDATLFYADHELPLPYDEFVSRVNIGHAIQYMNDYIGGSRVTLSKDEQQRVRTQAERNVYLQQPNWMVLFGGDVIDVEKIELLEYGDDHRSIYWRTVSSPNESAQSDDGRVTFRRSPNGCVRVEIFTRQKFSLPLFFHFTRIDLFPGFRDPIIEAGYKNFLSRTIANMEAVFDEREYRIGLAPQSKSLESYSGLSDGARYIATALATLSELFRNKGDFAGVGDWFVARSWTQSSAAVPIEDSAGFRHFGPAPSGTRYDKASVTDNNYMKQLEAVLSDAPGLYSGLASAIQRDFEAFAQKNQGSSES